MLKKLPFKGQCQLGSPMLHTKFEAHLSVGSGEEVFQDLYHIRALRPC